MRTLGSGGQNELEGKRWMRKTAQKKKTQADRRGDRADQPAAVLCPFFQTLITYSLRTFLSARDYVLMFELLFDVM